MEEKYKGKIGSLALICLFLFSTIIFPLNNGVPHTVNASLFTPPEHMNHQQATVSLYTFEKVRTRCYQVQLSIDDADELFNLLVSWTVAKSTSPDTSITDRIQQQLLNSLRKHWALPDDVIQDVLHALAIPTGGRNHVTTTRSTSVSLPEYQQRKTVFRASITSSGTGILVPMALAPRPRLTTIWKADSGKTLATNWVTKFGYNATGPHLGIALGFIGVGFSSRVPNKLQFVLVGGALMTVLFGDTITEIVPLDARVAHGL